MRPEDRFYLESHEWAKLDGDTISVGITDFAIEQLGELADAGVDEVIFSYYDLDSDAVPEFLASDVVPKL